MTLRELKAKKAVTLQLQVVLPAMKPRETKSHFRMKSKRKWELWKSIKNDKKSDLRSNRKLREKKIDPEEAGITDLPSKRCKVTRKSKTEVRRHLNRK